MQTHNSLTRSVPTSYFSLPLIISHVDQRSISQKLQIVNGLCFVTSFALYSHQVTALLDTKELPCSNEEDVLLAALRWITHDIVSRRRHSFHLLSSVRFRSLTLRDLDRAVSLLPVNQDKSFAVVIATLRKDLETGQLFK